jgi:hypothetical protein
MYIVTLAPKHSTSSSISSTLPSQLHKDNWNMHKVHVHYTTIKAEVFGYSYFHEKCFNFTDNAHTKFTCLWPSDKRWFGQWPTVMNECVTISQRIIINNTICSYILCVVLPWKTNKWCTLLFYGKLPENITIPVHRRLFQPIHFNFIHTSRLGEPWVPRDSDLRITVLVRTSSNCKWHTHLLIWKDVTFTWYLKSGILESQTCCKGIHCCATDC